MHPTATRQDGSVVLVDAGDEHAEGTVRAAAAEGRPSIVLADPATPARALALLRAGACGCVDRDADPDAVAAVVRAAAAGSVPVTPAVLRTLLEARPPARVADDVDLHAVRDVIGSRRFTIVFQQIADLSTGDVVAVEALARFTADRALAPDAWLAHAERFGLRVELEHELLAAALEAWSALDSDVSLSVNLSPAAAVAPGLADLLEGRPAERVIVEITDHRSVEAYEPLVEALAPLRRRGLRVAVDDSGEGLRSLHQLARLEPAFMKLGRTLTQNLDRDLVKYSLADSMLSFAGQIGCTVIAEGIETDGELRALRALGVQFGQGYRIARPKPLEELDLASACRLPTGTAVGVGEGADGAPAVVLPQGVRSRFIPAVRLAARQLVRQKPAATFAVAHLDLAHRRQTILAVDGPMAGDIPVGRSWAVEDTMCFHMVTGTGARACPDIASDPVYNGLAMAADLDAGAYAGVPLELADGSRVGTIFAVTRGEDGLTAADLLPMEQTAAALLQALECETAGMDRAEVMAHLRMTARTDDLTGTLNATGFDAALERSLIRGGMRARSWYVGVELADLASIRARYGHAVGDLAIKGIAAALADSAAGAATVGRIAEDRFAVVVTAGDREQAVARYLERFDARVAEFCRRREVVLSVRTAVVGLQRLEDPADAWDAAFATTAELV